MITRHSSRNERVQFILVLGDEDVVDEHLKLHGKLIDGQISNIEPDWRTYVEYIICAYKALHIHIKREIILVKDGHHGLLAGVYELEALLFKVNLLLLPLYSIDRTSLKFIFVWLPQQSLRRGNTKLLRHEYLLVVQRHSHLQQCVLFL